MRRKSNLGIVNSIQSDLRDSILNMKLPRSSLIHFEREENKKETNEITDLRDIDCKSESSVYSLLNTLIHTKQSFIYSGPLLININPGPTDKNYLNLDKWLQSISKQFLDNKTREILHRNIPITTQKPHMYSFIDYVYNTLMQENKSQTVNMLGSIASGKTFNLIHSLEYLCHIGCNPSQNKKKEIFDNMHKAVQVIHIIGSIFRHNNLESTSCGMKVNVSFNENNYIDNFNIDAKILDLTLPFSSTGRSFSILHAIISGSSNDVKKLLEFTDKPEDLVFFRKFFKTFTKSQHSRFKLNDLEIWNKFHSLLNYFLFTKQEILEIIQLLSIVILANELAVGKYNGKESNFETLFKIFKGPTSRKISTKLGITEEEFLFRTSAYENINQIKDFVSSLMKKCYQCVFEYIKNKIHCYLKLYFYCINNDIDFGFYLEAQGIILRTYNDSGKIIGSTKHRSISISSPNNVQYINNTHVPVGSNLLTKVNNNSIQTVINVTTINDHTINQEENVFSTKNNVKTSIFSNKNRSSSLLNKNSLNTNSNNNRSSFKINYTMNTNPTPQIQTINQTTQTNLVRNILEIIEPSQSRKVGKRNSSQLKNESTINRPSMSDTSNSKFLNSRNLLKTSNNNTNNKESTINTNMTIENNNTNNKQVKKISFIDFPGEIMDQTLGGFVTNIANECLNSYASSQYSSINKKLSQEGISIKYFQELHTKKVISELLGENGFLNNIDNYLNYPDSRVSGKIVEWSNNKKHSFFKCNFTTNSVIYDLSILRNEINSITYNETTSALMKKSNNSIIKWNIRTQEKKILSINKTYQQIIRELVNCFIKDLKGIHPFVVYCLHSNNSIKYFKGIENTSSNIDINDKAGLLSGFNNNNNFTSNNMTTNNIMFNINKTHLSLNNNDNIQESQEDNFLPYNITIQLMRRSLIMSVLYWEWFGFHDWINVDDFNDLFINDFLFIKNSMSNMKFNVRKFTKRLPDVNLENLNKYEKASCILSTFTEENKFVIGQKHILFKIGIIKQISKNLYDLKSKYTDEYNRRIAANNYKKSIYGVSMVNTTIANTSMIKRKSSVVKDSNSENNSYLNGDNNNKNPISTFNSKVNQPRISNNSNKRDFGVQREMGDTENFCQSTGNNNNTNNEVVNTGKFAVNNYYPTNTNNSNNNLNNIKISTNSNISYNNIPSLEAAEKRKSMKVQCHLNYIDKLNQIKTPYYEEEVPNNELFDLLEANYSAHQSTTPFNNINTDFINYKKENNIIVPKQDFFNRVKNLLIDNNNFKFFSYDDYKEQIVTLQAALRGFYIRLKYKTFRCVVSNVIKIQSLAKGVILRKKFKRYIQILYSTIFIQRMYKHRHKRRVESVSKIQEQARIYIFRMRVLKLIERKKKQNSVTIRAVAKKLSGSMIGFQESLLGAKNSPVKKSIKDKSNTYLDNDIEINNKEDDTFGTNDTLEEIYGLDPQTKNLLDKLEKIKVDKALITQKFVQPKTQSGSTTTRNKQTTKNFNQKIGNINHKYNEERGVLPKNTLNIKKKYSSVEIVSNEIENLKSVDNKNRIIDSLMSDMENFVYGKLIINKISILLLLYSENHNYRGIINPTANYSIYDLSSMGLLKRPHNKIEDKLIEYGKNKKLKVEAVKHENHKDFLNEYTFKPQLQAKQNKMNQNKKSQPLDRLGFFERQEKFLIKQQQKADDRKTEFLYENKDEKELTFKPKISKYAKNNIKSRTIEDLYKWQIKVDKNRQNLIEVKEKKELEEINRIKKNVNANKISKNTELILKNKALSQSMLNNENFIYNNDDSEYINNEHKDNNKTNIEKVMNYYDIDQEEELDLWPTKKLD